MKKLILITTILLISFSTFAQRSYYYKSKYEKTITYQVSADVIDYQGIKYGWSLGANIGEVFSLNYFHTRNYKQTDDSFMDTRFGGLHASMVLPVTECVQLGGSARWAYLIEGYYKRGRRMIYSAEARMDLGPTTKLVFEYGLSKANSLSSIRLVWNLY